MDKVFEALAKFFYLLAGLTDGTVFANLGINDAMRALSKSMYDKVGGATSKIGDLTGMSKIDALTLLNASLTAVLSTSSSTSQNGLQRGAAAALIAVGYLSDTVGHNEKIAAIEKVQADFTTQVLDKIRSRIGIVKVSSTPWGSYTEVDKNKIAFDGLVSSWDSCCVMEITLKDQGGTITCKNLKNMANAYRILSGLAGLGSLGVAITNFVLTLRGDEDNTIGLGAAGAIPIRLSSDLIARLIFPEQKVISNFLDNIVSSLKKELESAKAANPPRVTMPREIPAGLVVLLANEKNEKGLKEIEDLTKEYLAHNNSISDARVAVAEDAAVKSEKQRLLAEAATLAVEQEKDAVSAEAVKKEAELSNKLTTATDDVLLKDQKIQDLTERLLEIEAALKNEKDGMVAKEAIVEKLVTIFFEDCFEEHKLTADQKRTFIDKLKSNMQVPLSPTLNQIFERLESSYKTTLNREVREADSARMELVNANYQSHASALSREAGAERQPNTVFLQSTRHEPPPVRQRNVGQPSTADLGASISSSGTAHKSDEEHSSDSDKGGGHTKRM